MPWYVLRVAPPGNTANPADYLRVHRKPVCPGSRRLCAIQAQDDGFNHPVITYTLLAEMATALHQSRETANVCLRS